MRAGNGERECLNRLMPASSTDPEAKARDLADLLAHVALADRAAFARLYDKVQRDLFGVAWRVLGSRDMAEEALQEAFVNIWHNARNYRPAAGQPMTWMTAIVRNKALDLLRAEGRHGRHRAPAIDDADGTGTPIEVASAEPGPADLLARATDSIGIRQCMAALEPGPRQALALAYYKGLSHSEIGESMGAPVGTVKAWVRRSLDRLRHCLAAAGIVG